MILTDAEKKNKMSILVNANALHEKAKQKSKEVDVIAQDIEASEKIEDYVNVLACVWYMYYDKACFYIGICFGTLPCRV